MPFPALRPEWTWGGTPSRSTRLRALSESFPASRNVGGMTDSRCPLRLRGRGNNHVLTALKTWK
jgi:hypothetical protein